MANTGRELNLMQQSAVREMANIGLGHATTALAQVTGKSFNMEIPNVETVAFENVPLMLGNPMDTAVGIIMPIGGDVDGFTAFVFPWDSAVELWKALLGTSPEDPSQVDELAQSAMLEIGNIVSSSFLNAISDLADTKIHATPPGVSIDFVASIAASVVNEAEMAETVALALETRLYGLDDCDITGFFLCIPSAEGLQTLFEKLGIAEAA